MALYSVHYTGDGCGWCDGDDCEWRCTVYAVLVIVVYGAMVRSSDGEGSGDLAGICTKYNVQC